MASDVSLYLYPWDTLDQSSRAFAERVKQLGFSSLTLALSYHAGKFLRPQATAPRVVFPEDGVVYFTPRLSRYGSIQPKPASDKRLVGVADTLAGDIPLRAWTVLLHNTRLGYLHPEAVARNAWGDPYWYSLCPNHPAVFDYAVQLCADIADQPVQELVLESPGWLPYAHGYHHEFAQVRSNPWLEHLLGLCFCESCQQQFKAEVDGEALAAWVRQRVDQYLMSGVDASATQAQAWLQVDLLQQPDLLRWLQLRQQRVTDLVSTIRQQIPADKAIWVIPTIQRPTAAAWTEGSNLKALAEAATGLELPLYEASVEQVAADLWQVNSAVEDIQRIRAILRPGPPDLANGEQIAEAIQVVRAQGVQGLAFYNYGLLRPDRLQQLAQHLLA